MTSGDAREKPASRFAMLAVVGRPNAGKSTLINNLVGRKISIVSDKPQTTRHRILGILTEPRGQLVFVDTPGIHKPFHRLNKHMVMAAMGAVEETDATVLIVDASESYGQGDKYLLESLKSIQKPMLILLNKIDLIRKNRLLPLMETYGKALPAAEILPLSALTGENLTILKDKLWALAGEGEPMFPSEMLTDKSDAFRAAEIVREKILGHTHAELPWATAVRVDQSELDGELWRIHMSILVERRSQKPIVIGRHGAFLKQIGTEARQEIESAFGRKVFLALHVDVEERWRDDPRQLAALEIS